MDTPDSPITVHVNDTLVINKEHTERILAEFAVEDRLIAVVRTERFRQGTARRMDMCRIERYESPMCCIFSKGPQVLTGRDTKLPSAKDVDRTSWSMLTNPRVEALTLGRGGRVFLPETLQEGLVYDQASIDYCIMFGAEDIARYLRPGSAGWTSYGTPLRETEEDRLRRVICLLEMMNEPLTEQLQAHKALCYDRFRERFTNLERFLSTEFSKELLVLDRPLDEQLSPSERPSTHHSKERDLLEADFHALQQQMYELGLMSLEPMMNYFGTMLGIKTRS